MNASLRHAVLLVALFPACALASSAFDGTWKADLSQVQAPKKPDVYLLQNGRYECRTCVPPINITADGKDQPVTGQPYFDTIAIKILDDHAIQETLKKSGKVIFVETARLTLDGSATKVEFVDSSAPNGKAITGKETRARVEKGPPGAHLISGAWRVASYDTQSDTGLTVSYHQEGDTLHMSTLTGQSYAAKLDGSDAPYQGDPGVTSVSVRQNGERSVVETDKRDGKVVAVATMTVAADGRSMHVDIDDRLHGTSLSYVAVKQR